MEQDELIGDDWVGLMGSPPRVTVLEASLESLIFESKEYPSVAIPMVSLNWLRPLHQSMTDKGPSIFTNADFNAAFMSDCSKLMTDDAWT